MRARSRLALTLVLVVPFGCEQVLDIKDAELDPTFGAPEDPPDETPEPDGGPPPPSALCERYCSSVMNNCTGASAVFAKPENCLAVCALLPEGAEGDEIGNTVHCRARAAEAAPSEPDFYCPAAGPGGSGICGTNCESLCTITAGVCTGDNRQWDSLLACKTSCDALPDLGNFSTASEQGMARGDHVQCRLLHISAAAVYDPGVHCTHAAGAAPCAAPAPAPPP